MTELVRVGALRGIVMRGPGLPATLPFYEDMWGLSLAHKEEGIAYLRGTGTEPCLYGLKDGDVFGIEYVHFAMDDRAHVDALYDQVLARLRNSTTGSAATGSKCSTLTCAACASAPRRGCWTTAKNGPCRKRSATSC